MRIDSRITTILIALTVAAAATGLQAKELYRWTDENGVVHFSDRKPPGQQDFQASEVPDGAPPAPGADPYAPADADANAEEAAQPSVAQQRREEIAQKKQQAREDRAQRDAQCAAWRAEVERLEPNRRVFYTNEAGETERMDDVERVDHVADLKAQIAANCN